MERAAEGALKSACTDQAALRVLHVHRDIHRDDLMFRFAALVAILATAIFVFRSRPHEVVDIIIRILCVDLFSELIVRSARPTPPFYLARSFLASACFFFCNMP